jgi:5-formyltetrahydrofolate cyclo-ligase
LLGDRGITSIGLAFDIQLADELPLEPHDRGVDLVVTPSGLWRKAE